MKNLFCFGYGYTADYVGHALADDPTWTVAGTTRDEEKLHDLATQGVDSHIFNYEHPLHDILHVLKDTTHLLISTPPNDDGDPVFNIHKRDLKQLKNLQWVGYLSTTGVYGDRNGGDVAETDEIRPTSKRGSRRAKAEDQWLSLHKNNDLPVHIFRLSGIYGPGRSALDSVRAGVARRINKPGHAFSRIHVEDIVNILLRSIETPKAGEIYNVCDDEPAPSHEVIEYACNLLKRPVPPLVDFEDANLAPMTRSFYMDSRIVRNEKIKTELNVNLKYKNYREGLQGCMDAENYAVSLFKGMNT